MATPQNPLAVANFFVDRSLDTGEELTLLKVIKLTYIAHGWHLAIKDTELLSHAVEAWQYGPVVPTVYHKFKQYGNGQVKSFADDQKGLSFYIPLIEGDETKEFLEDIWSQYKQYNGLELSTLTHQRGTPWDKVFNNPKNKGKKGVIIPNGLIKEHYTEKLNANKQSFQAEADQQVIN